MQERLTLHVRRLVHISQVSSVFLKSQCQCSCTDALTKILIPCQYGNCFKRCWRYISLCGFNNNKRFNRLKYAPQNEVRIVLYSLLHCRFQALQCFFFTEKLHYGIQVGGIFSAGYRYSEYSAGIGNRAFVSVGVCLVFLDVGAEA